MEFNHPNRAMQAALELSMLNLNNTSYSMTSPEPPFGLFEDEIPIGTKPKSQNITQCVAVATSEHVAEIVGRQGCKIKALRAKTNTYIKTPLRGEEPVFIVTGRPEDVASAMREIKTAAEHFTQIRAKKNHQVPSSSDKVSTELNSMDGNKVSILVRVPYRVVGLVVGPKGATVKRIQQVTSTYIKTPSRDKDPAFEVRGTPENVQKAKLEIESYIAVRTGGAGGADTPESSEGEYSSEHSYGSPELYNLSNNLNVTHQRVSVAESGYFPAEELHMSPMANAVFYGARQDCIPISAPVMPSPEQTWDFTSFSDSLVGIDATLPRPTPMRVNAALSAFAMEKCQPPSPTYSCESASSDGLSTSSPKVKSKRVFSGPSCTVCREPAGAALIPCGHSLFCWSCANYIDEYVHRCPVCSIRVEHHVRIHSR